MVAASVAITFLVICLTRKPTLNTRNFKNIFEFKTDLKVVGKCKKLVTDISVE